MAKDAKEALRLANKTKATECWVDDEWKKGNAERLESAIGFNIEE